MMQQYHDAKQAVGDALLLFRMGDFYELFHDDAKTAARVLGLSLTSRDKGTNGVPMAGFPHHQLNGYLAKIIAAGYRAAICDQVEDPREAKGIVRREVTRIVTAGTVTDDALLDPQASNFLAAIACPAHGPPSAIESFGLAWVDLSTGRFYAATFSADQLADQLARIAPAECLVNETAPPLPAELPAERNITRRPSWAFAPRTAADALQKHFGTQSLDGFGLDADRSTDGPAIAAAGAVLDYLNETQKSSLAHIDRIVRWSAGQSLEIDPATRRSLEITQTLRTGRREGSLLGVVDRTVTAMGARLLAEWLAAPLVDADAINARLDAVEETVADAQLAGQLRESLRSIYDIERLLARVTTGRASPRDLGFVGRTLAALPKVKAKLTGRRSQRLVELESRIDLCPEIRGRLEDALVDDCPLASREGGIIRPGFHPQLDELRALSAGGKQWMAQYQASETERTGITSLKVGFNRVFGYYLEVTHAHRDKVPAEYIRKQTLKNAERYITPELKEYEEKVLTAEERAIDIEYELFSELRELVARNAGRLRTTAAALAEVDVLAGLAELARSRGYVRPEVVDEPVLDITEGRHPVLDITEPEGTFVPNGVQCEAKAEGGRGKAESQTDDASDQDSAFRIPHSAVLLITGPNMAGKSTYIRQAALLTLLAQIGSFVPARRARIGVADRIFARVGASDELSRGQSTFMVEMTETARILNTATRRSLVILDEIGRGTSTYDGLSLAWSIVEHIHDQIGCRTLFATHYHELTDLEAQLPGVRNLNVAVKEWDDQVAFLHQVVPGAAGKSYGIHVARLAGVPSAVNERARQVLALLEGGGRKAEGGREMGERRGESRACEQNGQGKVGTQLTLFEVAEHPLLETIRQANLNETTPLEALQLVAEWQRQLSRPD
jgi:DNA mismatch repair protein MutS